MNFLACGIVLLTVVLNVHSNFVCYCDVNHQIGYIVDCPVPTKVIGTIIRPDNVFPYHNIDLMGPYCKAVLSNVQGKDGYVAVLHANQVGYLYLDSGYEKHTCPGAALFNTATLARSSNCTHVINGTIGLQGTGNNPVTTHASPVVTTHPPTTKPPTTAVWVPVTSGTAVWIPVTSQTLSCTGKKIEDAVSKKLTVFDSEARTCGYHGISDQESVLFNFCNAPKKTDLWKQSSKVEDECKRLARYTPVAFFYNNKALSGDGSGVFLECTQHGFKMIRQTCTAQALEVVEITFGRGTSNLFVVQ